jgi:hypothetical protein
MRAQTFKKKRELEQHLIKKYGQENVSASPYDECGYDENGDHKITKLWLYYNNGEHVATWAVGKEGWTLKKVEA